MRSYVRHAHLNLPRTFWDALLTLGMFPIAIMAARSLHQTIAFQPLLWMPLLYTFIFLVSMSARGLYEAGTFTYHDRTLRGVTASCLCAALGCVVFLLLMPQSQGNTDVLALYSLLTVLLLGIRYFIALSARGMLKAHSAPRVLLVGCPTQLNSYLYYLDKTSFRIKPVGVLTKDPQTKVQSLPCLGTPEDLERVLDAQVIDEVVMAFPQEAAESVQPVLSACARRGIPAKVAMDLWETEGAKCHVYSVGPLPVLLYHRSNLSCFQHGMKRALDMVFAILAGILSLPLVLGLALAVKCDSFGPALVRIPRQGRGGRPFRQWRLRITRPGCGETSRNPDQFTRVGKFLFRTRLHYLPSFWNILMGEMSVVGVRGSLKSMEETEGLPVLAAKPGLTGLWHVRDFDRVLDETDLYELDREYAESWNLLMDLRLFFLTPVISLIHRIIGQEPEREEYS